ncbi:MAG: helix-turn-helix domain-containing protein [Clostridia bacterium]|nr:helix-turn-helix domain-containing protein [Clostridia bacterium]
MQDMRLVIAKNLTELRKARGMTQLELAEKLNYSDKAVSKWERGESLPDITVIKTIADLFEVTVDYLITEEHAEPLPPPEATKPPKKKLSLRTAAAITGMSILLVCLIAAFLFFILCYAIPSSHVIYRLLPFIYSVPIASIVWLVMNSIWFNRRRNYLIISLLMWSTLGAIWLTVLPFINLWLIFILGIPGEAIILLWSGMRFKKKTPEAPMEETKEE